MITDLKPAKRQRIYDLVREAGVDVSDWANYQRPESPETNPKYCYNWSFLGSDRVVLCLWHRDMDTDDGSIYQKLNCREIAAAKHQWSSIQCKRAADMDHAIQLARNRRLPIRVIVVDGLIRYDTNEESRGHVERRLLDPEPWHVAVYDNDGNCRLQRGPWPPLPEPFTADEIWDVGTLTEGAVGEATIKTRERSVHLRNLAREHFAKSSSDGRLHCAACGWAPPPVFELNGPIVEIHHGVGIAAYPKDGRALTFDEAIRHLAPLCPNCHRMIHAKKGGGTFTLAEISSHHPSELT